MEEIIRVRSTPLAIRNGVFKHNGQKGIRKFAKCFFDRNTNEQIEERAFNAVVKYLKSIGWSVAVGGFDSIEMGDRKHKYRLIFGFVGKKVDTPKSN